MPRRNVGEAGGARGGGRRSESRRRRTARALAAAARAATATARVSGTAVACPVPATADAGDRAPRAPQAAGGRRRRHVGGHDVAADVSASLAVTPERSVGRASLALGRPPGPKRPPTAASPPRRWPPPPPARPTANGSPASTSGSRPVSDTDATKPVGRSIAATACAARCAADARPPRGQRRRPAAPAWGGGCALPQRRGAKGGSGHLVHCRECSRGACGARRRPAAVGGAASRRPAPHRRRATDGDRDRSQRSRFARDVGGGVGDEDGRRRRDRRLCVRYSSADWRGVGTTACQSAEPSAPLPAPSRACPAHAPGRPAAVFCSWFFTGAELDGRWCAVARRCGSPVTRRRRLVTRREVSDAGASRPGLLRRAAAEEAPRATHNWWSPVGGGARDRRRGHVGAPRGAARLEGQFVAAPPPQRATATAGAGRRAGARAAGPFARQAAAASPGTGYHHCRGPVRARARRRRAAAAARHRFDRRRRLQRRRPAGRRAPSRSTSTRTGAPHGRRRVAVARRHEQMLDELAEPRGGRRSKRRWTAGASPRPRSSTPPSRAGGAGAAALCVATLLRRNDGGGGRRRRRPPPRSTPAPPPRRVWRRSFGETMEAVVRRRRVRFLWVHRRAKSWRGSMRKCQRRTRLGRATRPPRHRPRRSTTSPSRRASSRSAPRDRGAALGAQDVRRQAVGDPERAVGGPPHRIRRGDPSGAAGSGAGSGAGAARAAADAVARPVELD